MHIDEETFRTYTFQVPAGLIKESDDKFALRIYLSFLLHEDTFQPKACTLKDVAEDARLFTGKRITKKMLEQVRVSVDYLETHKYIELYQKGTVAFEGDVKKVTLAYLVRGNKKWGNDKEGFTRASVKECDKLLRLAADIDSNRCGVSSANVLRVYFMIKYQSYYWQKNKYKNLKDQIPAYKGAFKNLGDSDLLDMSPGIIMLAIGALERAGAISVWYGLMCKEIYPTEKGRTVPPKYQKVSLVIAKWCTNDVIKEIEIEAEAKRRVNETNHLAYDWRQKRYINQKRGSAAES